MSENRDVGPAVAVIGGGWAGCAAAVTLARAGFAVTVFEQAKTLGGRARRVVLDGLALDNGQHLLIGAYRQTQGLLATVHGGNGVAGHLHRMPLTLAPFAATEPQAITLRAWRMPAPLNLAAGMLAARGLSWTERLALIGGYRRLARAAFRCLPGQTVAECFAGTPRRAFDGVWAPLCVAALNTAPHQASAQIFANVLRDAFSAPAANSDFLIPATDLSALFPEPAARYVVAHGGQFRLGARVRRIAPGTPGIAIDAGDGGARFAAAIVCVGPHQLAAAVGADATPPRWRDALAQVRAFAYESITTIYLAYPRALALPAPIARLDDAPGQWVFDRSSSLPRHAADAGQALLAVVISAHGPHDTLDHPTLAARVDAQLRRLAPGLPAPRWSRVIAERRATYACVPGLARPPGGSLGDGLYLAGDYTDPELPPTLEAATRSGAAAARALADELRQGRRTR